MRALEEGLGRPSAFDADVTSNYLEIIYDSEFVESLAVTLEALEPPGPAEPDGTSHHSAIDAHRPLTSHTP